MIRLKYGRKTSQKVKSIFLIISILFIMVVVLIVLFFNNSIKDRENINQNYNELGFYYVSGKIPKIVQNHVKDVFPNIVNFDNNIVKDNLILGTPITYFYFNDKTNMIETNGIYAYPIINSKNANVIGAIEIINNENGLSASFTSGMLHKLEYLKNYKTHDDPFYFVCAFNETIAINKNYEYVLFTNSNFYDVRTLDYELIRKAIYGNDIY
ncbi:MAG: hypothetical protein FWC09_04585 [Lachnospiraceae bacterium]|nr:hypothetical protein [Lachnospiraceae bacterium]